MESHGRVILFLLFAFLGACSKYESKVILNCNSNPNRMTWEKDILPIFQANCFSCHGASNPSGGVNLSTYESSKAVSEKIYSAASRMPPPPATAISAALAKKIQDWISDGAAKNDKDKTACDIPVPSLEPSPSPSPSTTGGDCSKEKLNALNTWEGPPESAALKPVFLNKCATCHKAVGQPGAVKPPLTTYDEVVSYGPEIANRIQAIGGSIMPPLSNPQLTTTEKEAMLNWVKLKEPKTLDDLLKTCSVLLVPGNVSGTSPSSGEIKVQWSDTNTTESGYSLEYKKQVDQNYTVLNLPPDSVIHTLLGLVSDTNYQIRMRAFNATGFSDYSPVITVKTQPPPANKPNAPSQLRSSSYSESEVKLLWLDNSNNESEFEIQYWKTSSPGSVSTKKVPSQTVETIVGSLANNTEYMFQVRACNMLGCSNFSNTTKATTLPTCASVLNVEPLRRLTKSQFAASYFQIFVGIGYNIFEQLNPFLEAYPDSDPTLRFSTMAHDIPVEVTFAANIAAQVFVDFVIEDPNALNLMGLNCFKDNSGTEFECLDKFLNAYGPRIIRRPLTADERTRYQQLYNTGKGTYIPPRVNGLRTVWIALLQSPQFLFMIEDQGTVAPNDPNQLVLTAYEKASRLSFYLTGAGPTVDLLTTAANGGLDTPQGLINEAVRLFPMARDNAFKFYTEWLQYQPAVHILNEEFQNKGENEIAGKPPNYNTAYAHDAEFYWYVIGHTFGDAFDDKHLGTLVEFYTSNRTYIMKDFDQPFSLAPFYDLDYTQQEWQTVPELYRGFFSRGFNMRSNSPAVPLIKRAYRMAEKHTGLFLERPDPEKIPPDQVIPPKYDKTKTTRQAWHEQTIVNNPLCADCHTQFNAFGYVTTGTNVIGRKSLAERLFDPATGKYDATLIIDNQATLPEYMNYPAPVRGTVQLSDVLSIHPTVHENFVKKWLQFGTGNKETAENACISGHLKTQVPTKSIRDVWFELMNTAYFNRRKIQ